MDGSRAERRIQQLEGLLALKESEHEKMMQDKESSHQKLRKAFKDEQKTVGQQRAQIDDNEREKAEMAEMVNQVCEERDEKDRIIDELQQVVAAQGQTIDAKDKEILALCDDKTSIEHEKIKLKNKHQRELQEWKQEVEDEREELVKKNEVVNQQNTEIDGLVREQKHNHSRIKTLKQDAESLSKQLDEKSQELVKAKKEAEDLTIDFNQKQSEVQELKISQAKTIEQLKTAEAFRDESEATISDLKTQLTTKTSEADDLHRKLEQQALNFNHLDSDHTKLEADLKAKIAELQASQKELLDMEAKLQKCDFDLQEKTRQYREVCETSDRQIQEITENLNSNRKYENKIAALQREIEDVFRMTTSKANHREEMLRKQVEEQGRALKQTEAELSLKSALSRKLDGELIRERTRANEYQSGCEKLEKEKSATLRALKSYKNRIEDDGLEIDSLRHRIRRLMAECE